MSTSFPPDFLSEEAYQFLSIYVSGMSPSSTLIVTQPIPLIRKPSSEGVQALNLRDLSQRVHSWNPALLKGRYLLPTHTHTHTSVPHWGGWRRSSSNSKLYPNVLFCIMTFRPAFIDKPKSLRGQRSHLAKQQRDPRPGEGQ